MVKITFNGETRILSHKEEQAYKRRLYAKSIRHHMVIVDHALRNTTTMKELRRIKSILDKIVRADEFYENQS